MSDFEEFTREQEEEIQRRISEAIGHKHDEWSATQKRTSLERDEALADAKLLRETLWMLRANYAEHSGDGDCTDLDSLLRKRHPWDLAQGLDGDAVIYRDAILLGDMFFNTLKINPGVSLYPNGFRIHIKEGMHQPLPPDGILCNKAPSPDAVSVWKARVRPLTEAERETARLAHERGATGGGGGGLGGGMIVIAERTLESQGPILSRKDDG